MKLDIDFPNYPKMLKHVFFSKDRDAWTYTWDVLYATIPIHENDSIPIEVVAKLKKEFHCYQVKRRFKYMCKIQRQEDSYHPKLSVTELIA